MKSIILFLLIIMAFVACSDDGLTPTNEEGGVVPQRSNINSPNPGMVGPGVSGAGSFRSERFKGFGTLSFMQRGKRQ